MLRSACSSKCFFPSEKRNHPLPRKPTDAHYTYILLRGPYRCFFSNKVCVLFLQNKHSDLQISEIHYTLLSKPNPLKTHLKTLFVWSHWHSRAEMTHFTLREFALCWLMVLLRLLKVCSQENYIAQRLLFYDTGDLIEFSVMFYWSSNRCVLYNSVVEIKIVTDLYKVIKLYN